MQGYQSHIVLQGSRCPCALNLCLPVGTGLAPVPLHPSVPVSPGHVRPLHPYPPSYRRRR